MVPLMRGQSVGKGSVGRNQLELPKISLRLSILDVLVKGFCIGEEVRAYRRPR